MRSIYTVQLEISRLAHDSRYTSHPVALEKKNRKMAELEAELAELTAAE